MTFRPFAAKDIRKSFSEPYGDGLVQEFHLFPLISTHILALKKSRVNGHDPSFFQFSLLKQNKLSNSQFLPLSRKSDNL